MQQGYSRYVTWLLVALAFFVAGASYSQTDPQDMMVPPATGFRTKALVIGNDTFALVDLDPAYVYGEFQYKSRRHHEMWTRVKYNVKIVYPYAILAAAKLREYDKALENIPDERLKKEFVKTCERDLRTEFEDELKSLTVSQGKILMKLIDREAGKTTYEVVKQFRGGFQAAMWQTVARLFGHNMKAEYDAGAEDIMIERAVKIIEAGEF